MRIEGKRSDGVLLIDIGSGQRVLVDLPNGRHTKAIDGLEVDRYGPWGPADNSSEMAQRVKKSLESGRRVDIKHLADAPPIELRYRELMDGLNPVTLQYAGEHPFTHCMEVIVPAMAEQGREPDDPEAFCAWWKEHNASNRTMLSMSYDERRQRVDSALRQKMGIPSGIGMVSDFWIRDMNDEAVIYQTGGKTYRRSYTMDETDGTVRFSDSAEEVMQEWEPLRKPVLT